MRALFLILVLAFATPAAAADWEPYGNARFGYRIEVPPGFDWGKEADNGDGRSFRSGATKLLVWGGNIVEGDFEDAVAAAKGYSADEGWAITYEAVTPSWASYSGMQGKRILYQRMIASCDGQFAAFRLEYSSIDMAALDPVVNRLVQTLKGGLLMVRIVEREAWARHPTRRSGEWEGGADANVTVILHDSVDVGGGPRLHSHPYPETFIIEEGRAVFIIGDEEIEAGPGQIIVVPAGTPHKFRTLGPMKSIHIHATPAFDTTWLE